MIYCSEHCRSVSSCACNLRDTILHSHHMPLLSASKLLPCHISHMDILVLVPGLGVCRLAAEVIVNICNKQMNILVLEGAAHMVSPWPLLMPGLQP